MYGELYFFTFGIWYNMCVLGCMKITDGYSKCGRLRTLNLSKRDNLKRAEALEFTAISPILYIECCQ